MIEHMNCYIGRSGCHGILLLFVLTSSLISQCWCEDVHCSEDHYYEETVSDVCGSRFCELHSYDRALPDSSRESCCQVCKPIPLCPEARPKKIGTVPEGKDKRDNPLAASSDAISPEICFQASKPNPLGDANDVSNTMLRSLRSVIILQ